MAPPIEIWSACKMIADVGRQIAELREDSGFTQAQFSEKLEMSGQYLRRVESGINLSIRSLFRFADAFGVDVAELFTAPRSSAKRNPGRPPKRK